VAGSGEKTSKKEEKGTWTPGKEGFFPPLRIKGFERQKRGNSKRKGGGNTFPRNSTRIRKSLSNITTAEQEGRRGRAAGKAKTRRGGGSKTQKNSIRGVRGTNWGEPKKNDDA